MRGALVVGVERHDRLAHAAGAEESAAHALALEKVDRDVDVLVGEGQEGHDAMEQVARLVPPPGLVQAIDVHEGPVDGRGGDEMRAAVEGLDELWQRPASADRQFPVSGLD